MPEPRADVFGDALEDEEVGTGDEDLGLLVENGESQPRSKPVEVDGVDEDVPEEVASMWCRCSCCSLGICGLFLLSFILLTHWGFMKRQGLEDLDDLMNLKDSFWSETTAPLTPDAALPIMPTAFVAEATTSTATSETTTTTTTTTRTTESASVIDPNFLSSVDTVEKALACMRLTNPQLEATYPDDAEEHFQEIYDNISSFVSMDFPAHHWAGYTGPWIENYWIKNFTSKWFQRAEGTRLRDVFGPFIPIFVPWVDLAVRERAYPAGMIDMLKQKMRKTVLYVTVSQHDLGVFGGAKMSTFPQSDMPNLFVFSAGGFGHIPVPLLKQPETPLPDIPIASRRYFVSFVGSGWTNRGVRQNMEAVTKAWGEKTHREVFVNLKGMNDWKEVLVNSSVTLTPRGFGRSSFRAGEMLQMGRVPLYIWDDVPWSFYRELWDQEIIGFSVQIKGLEKMLDHVAEVGFEKLQSMEEKILSMRNSHFSYEGIMDQISKFLTGRGGSSDLRCVKFKRRRRRRRRLKWLRPLRRLQRWVQEWLV
ncbi:unnamed protein product [Cladocopium goreaui]|uniref:Exostosin GT47 domain-containing protein n=1 Tax=Cladocopium goreaui TaxID=2562237 RepID=A0A9P1BUQ8_9DINO|nr:unnamed protein product [Cladocopium goreaui]CAI3991230.1 unnamed protein product [Cladocopium goreaui]